MIRELYGRAKQFLAGRAGAYRRVFDPQSRDVNTVLVDLARFCRAHSSTGSTDALIAARLEGRREVWLRIQEHTRLDDETLWLLYGGHPQAKED